MKKLTPFLIVPALLFGVSTAQANIFHWENIYYLTVPTALIYTAERNNAKILKRKAKIKNKKKAAKAAKAALRKRAEAEYAHRHAPHKYQ
jgi:hypothetical protein